MLFILFLIIIIISSIDGIYKSTIEISSKGLEFQPKNNVQLISIQTIRSRILCSAACNQVSSCRIFDYDLVSKRCRLFESDSTTGSIISSSSSTSIVGTVRISSSLYSSSHNQVCQACEQNRYEICSTNTSACQCPPHTYWNGSICVLQVFQNDTCQQSDMCRSDLNLTCTSNCYGEFPKCLRSVVDNTTLSSSMRAGITVAGGCNGSSSTNQTILYLQAGITLDSSNNLYVNDDSYQTFVFSLNNRTGRSLRTFNNWPAFIFYDNRTSKIYTTVYNDHLAYIWPTNQTIPPNGIGNPNCLLTGISLPTGIAVDSIGNVYIASYHCSWVMKWAPNATSGTIIAGSLSGDTGTDSQSLWFPYNLALDEANSCIYVADRYNNRIQRFVLGGSDIGVTVAGGNGQGSAANQLYHPTDISLSKLDGSLYIADCYNNRIQKWQINATAGITIAGSSSGVAGLTAYLIDDAYGLAIDSTEKYLYVSDSNNNRIQRFSLQ